MYMYPTGVDVPILKVVQLWKWCSYNYIRVPSFTTLFYIEIYNEQFCFVDDEFGYDRNFAYINRDLTFAILMRGILYFVHVALALKKKLRKSSTASVFPLIWVHLLYVWQAPHTHTHVHIHTCIQVCRMFTCVTPQMYQFPAYIRTLKKYPIQPTTLCQRCYVQYLHASLIADRRTYGWVHIKKDP